MQTETALTVTDGNISPADIFFDRPLVVTDWDEIRTAVSKGVITSATILQEIKGMEPLAEKDARDFEHWRKQQVLRLCLLHEAGKPLEATATCKTCGERKADPLYGDKWNKQCLHCEEENQQSYHLGYRDNCEFILPRFNTLSKCWGLLYYQSRGSDEAFIFWVVDFYKTRQAATAALQPVKHYTDWLDVKYNGLMTNWHDFHDIVGLDELMKMNLPLTPEQFRELIRSKLEIGMSQEHNLMSYYLRDVMREYERLERDK